MAVNDWRWPELTVKLKLIFVPIRPDILYSIHTIYTQTQTLHYSCSCAQTENKRDQIARRMKMNAGEWCGIKMKMKMNMNKDKHKDPLSIGIVPTVPHGWAFYAFLVFRQIK